MIFITVGLHNQQFDRLLKKVDELITENKIKENVIMQTGSSNYKPKNAKWFKFSDFKSIEKLNKKASLIISHGGAGCIITALSYNKPIIAVPRLKKFGEHVNDHQLELVSELEKQKYVTAVYDVKNLEEAIEITRNKKHKRVKNKKIFQIIENYLDKIK